MEKNTAHTGETWGLKTKIADQNFQNFDFSKTNFNSPIFENVQFEDCLFDNSNLDNARLFYECNFSRCVFKNVNLTNSTFGSNKGVYTDCVFEKCDFRGVLFNFTRFVGCKFIHCKLKKVSFNGSSFYGCRFVGKMEDVTFNGIYHTNESAFSCLENVDFSEAVFGEFVGFEDCDLSTCIPPKGKTFEEILYVMDRKNPKHLTTGTKDRYTF